MATVRPTRQANRHAVNLLMRLGDLPVGRSRDLSVAGVFLETGHRPPIGTSHPLTLAWGDFTVECVARVVRHDVDGIGVEFVTPDNEFKQAVIEATADAPPTHTD